MIDRVNLSPANFHDMVTDLLAPAFDRALERGQIREGVTLDMAAEWVTRIVLSLITYPGRFLEDEDALRQYLRRLLVPSIIRVGD